MRFRESAAGALPPPAGSSSHIGSERVLVVTYVTDPPALDYNSRVERMDLFRNFRQLFHSWNKFYAIGVWQIFEANIYGDKI
ncbi:hypothetical protein Ddc_18612 [Ditylenchus destructor]|nr:hypothetical protein Ddc_18612 [Ditylenchus destructor]